MVSLPVSVDTNGRGGARFQALSSPFAPTRSVRLAPTRNVGRTSGEAHVRPTLEVIVNESPAHLRKVLDPESGLALIQPGAP
jgi:hypothetical protein